VKTVEVTKGTLSATVSQGGTLTYRARPDNSPYSVINQAPGTYTELPALGQVISQGQVLYRVNDIPVVLLAGSTPAYRTLSLGATGPDVAQLNADLVALGSITAAQLNPTSASFGPVTAFAVAKLQTTVGLAPTGTLALGQAVYQPTAVRVTTVAAEPGAGAQPGQAVLQGTSDVRQVQVALEASQQADVAVGDTVTITLPDNRTTPGVVFSVGTVAVSPANSGSGGSGDAIPTITVDVIPSDPAGTGTWDQAPVQVGITTARVPDALAVPVTALLARPGQGYVVELAPAHDSSRFVPVSLGLFDDADGLVQVTGSGLAAGQRVVVPST
jgi:hypothetical protein